LKFPKTRFISAINITSNCLYKNTNENLDLAFIRDCAESFIFNILFIRYCEVNQILPIRCQDYGPISLTSLVEKLDDKTFDPELDESDPDIQAERLAIKFGEQLKYSPIGTDLYKQIVKITEIIHDGTGDSNEFGFKIKGFRNTVFSKEEWKFINKVKIRNEDLCRIIFQLMFAESDLKGRPYQQIPYNQFTPRQLGSIYESFLEYGIEQADHDKIFEGGEWVDKDLSSHRYRKFKGPKVYKDDLYFIHQPIHRKSSGTYYTPDYVVRYIVEKSLSSCVGKSTSKDILNVKILDPAIGSGHFISYACEYLGKKLLEALDKEGTGDNDISLQEAKERIAENCLFGIDINPRAVRLAKMSLWLSTAYQGCVLSDHNKNLLCADSLKIDLNKMVPEIVDLERYRVIIGNPPYYSVDATFGQHSEYCEFLKTRMPEVYTDKTDIYYYFLGLGAELKIDSLGFIVSRAFLEADKAKKLRSTLSLSQNVNELIDFRGYQVFDAGITTAIILTSSKIHQNKRMGVRKLINESITDEELEKDLFGSQEYFESNENSSDLLNGNRWSISYSDFESDSVLKIDQGTINLGTLPNFSVGKGMETGLNKCFQINADEAAALGIPPELLKTRARNSDIHKYLINNSGKSLLYLEDFDSFESLPASVRKRLNSFKKDLEGRAAFKRGNCEWYRYTWPLHKDKYVYPRLICPFYAESNRFGLDENFSFLGSTDTYCIFETKGNVGELLYLQGILNSRIMEFRYKKIAKLKSRNVYEYVDNSLVLLPIKNSVNADLKSQVIKFSKELNKKFDPKIYAELEIFIAKIYGISTELVKQIDNYLTTESVG
jgi:type I restriction-modification system DNA methylase subunit